MVGRLETPTSYKETGAIACLALGMYCPNLRIGGTAHINPPYVPVLDFWLSQIPFAVRQSSIVVVTGVAFPLDGNDEINRRSERCQVLARYHIRESLIRNGIRPPNIINEFSPPNTITSLSLHPRSAYAEIRRINPFRHSDEIQPVYF